jgi:DHA2 family multidrug resistance protein
VDTWWLVWPVVVQGLGLGMVFVPLSTIAFSTLDQKHSAEASGLYSLLRTIGSSIGISIVAATLTRHTQMAWNQLGAHIQPFNPALPAYLAPLHLEAQDPQAAALLAHELSRQAQMIGFLDAFTLIMWSFIAMAPMVFLLRKPKKIRAESAVAAAS